MPVTFRIDFFLTTKTCVGLVTRWNSDLLIPWKPVQLEVSQAGEEMVDPTPAENK